MAPDFLAHILVLEDDSVLREVMCELLLDEGYTVEAAAGGLEALAHVASSRFDLLIFDIRMEGMDGLEALARMQAGGAQFPSLAITGFAGDDAPVRALKLGVGDYLRKPFQPEQLLGSVARLLAAFQREQETRESLDAVLQVARWAAAELARTPEQGRWLQRVSALCEATELLPAQSAELIITALVSPGDASTAPPRVREWYANLTEHYDGSGPQGRKGQQIPVQAQLLGLASESQPAPGRFDPLLVEALDRVQVQPETADARRWLGLAHGLLARGQSHEAQHLLSRLVEEGPGCLEAVQAALTLGQLRPGQAGDWVRKAVDLARQLGPVTTARAMQRGALLLHRLGLPEAEAAVRHAEQRLTQAGLRAEAALMQLVRGDAPWEALELLLRPENESLLTPELPHLFPHLRQHAPERLLKRLLIRYPYLDGQKGGLRVVSFGPLQVFAAGRPIAEPAWRGPLVKYLFAYLARQTRPVQEEQILDAFWPEGHENSRRRLSGALSAMRRTLTQETGTGSDPIVRSRDRLSLHPSLLLAHDVQEFEQARALAAHEPAQGLEQWSRMAVLYQGPYLEGCYMDWALLERARLEELYLEALLRTAQQTLENQPERCLEAAQQILQIDPLHQAANLLVLQGWPRVGQPERSLRHFERYQHILHRDLGAEPSLESVELFHRARLAVS